MEASLAREILALLYADDLVGIAFTAEGLQSDIIDPCAEYARRHRYRANVPKCGVMVCGPASVVQGLPARTFTWGQTEIPRVLQYKHLFSFFFFGGRNLTCRSILPMTAIPSRQIQETSRIVGHTARPTPGEAVSPWQATSTVHHDNLMGPPSRGGRIQSRMAPGMYHPCLSGRDTSKPRARRWPLTGGRLPREPTYAPILQPSSDATPCG